MHFIYIYIRAPPWPRCLVAAASPPHSTLTQQPPRSPSTPLCCLAVALHPLPRCRCLRPAEDAHRSLRPTVADAKQQGRRVMRRKGICGRRPQKILVCFFLLWQPDSSTQQINITRSLNARPNPTTAYMAARRLFFEIIDLVRPYNQMNHIKAWGKKKISALTHLNTPVHFLTTSQSAT